MADRDWDKELSKIDKQLASLSDEALLGPTPVQIPAPTKPAKGSASAPGSGGVSKPAPRSAPASPRAAAEPRATSSWGVYARLSLSVALGVGMVLWPYPSRCGAGLAAYLASVVVVVTSGVWSSVWTWRHRASHAHALSLLLILWGLVLGSMEILPRVGYAKPDLAHPGGWACVAPAAKPLSGSVPPPVTP